MSKSGVTMMTARSELTFEEWHVIFAEFQRHRNDIWIYLVELNDPDVEKSLYEGEEHVMPRNSCQD